MKKLIKKFMNIFKSNDEEEITHKTKEIKIAKKKVKGLNPKKKKSPSPHKLSSEKKKRK